MFDGLRHRWLNNIPADVLLVAGVSDTSILTGVVMMHIPGLRPAGHSDHVAAALPAPQFSGQEVILIAGAVVPVLTLFHLDDLLYLVPQNIVNDRWDTSLDSSFAVNINSTVPLIATQDIETAFVPFAAGLSFYPSAVQIARNIHEHFARGDTSVNLPDDGCCGFIHNNPAILATLVAQRLPTIGHALAGVVH